MDFPSKKYQLDIGVHQLDIGMGQLDIGVTQLDIGVPPRDGQTCAVHRTFTACQQVIHNPTASHSKP